MTDYVSPQVAEAAKSTRSEADVRELAKAKDRAWMALLDNNRRKQAAMSDGERADLEIEAVRLGRAYVAANDALMRAV